MEAKDYGEILKLVPGFDFIEVTGGVHGEALKPKPLKHFPKQLSEAQKRTLRGYYESLSKDYEFKPMYNLEYARIIKVANPNLKISLVGGIRKQLEMNQLIESGDADFVSFGRPFIRQPQLVKDLADGAKRVDCIDCGMCIAFLAEFPPSRCFMKDIH